MRSLKTIVVDDEFMARESVIKLLNTYCKNIEIIGEASNIDDAERIILSQNPDLAILDIRMPGGTGFELLQRFQNINFNIIFITAYDEYAIKAFKYSAIDYLLKPVEPNQLIHAINKISVTHENERLIGQIKIFLEQYPEHLLKTHKIRISSPSTTFFINLKDLVRAESNSKNVKLIFKGNEDIIINKSLKDFEQMTLKYDYIYRIHKSHLINLNHVISFEKNNNSLIVNMADNSSLSVSVRKREKLIGLLMQQVEF
jgi:two-component system LytT family response regulator